MKRIVAILLLISLALICLPKEFFHDHEEEITADSGAHFDEDCFVCDLNLSIFEATIGIVLSLVLVRFSSDFVRVHAYPRIIFVPSSSDRGPPAFS